jgi:hypothetical protein
MEKTALPRNEDSSFMETDDSDAIRSLDRDSNPDPSIAGQVGETAGAQLFVRMINEGNMCDITAELGR